MTDSRTDVQSDDFEDDLDGDFVDYQVEFTVCRKLRHDEENDYVSLISGRICQMHENCDDVEAGTMDAYLFETGRALNEHFPLSDVFDESIITDAYVQPLLAHWDELGESLGMWPDRVLILDRTEILPAFRGKHLGMWADFRCIDTFGGTEGLVVARPYPLQFSGEEWVGKNRERLGLDQFDGDRQRAFQKLTAYWQQMGYERLVGNDDHAIYYINPATVHPQREDVLGKDYERLD